MSVVLASSITFDASPLALFGPDNPLIGWHNIATAATISASSENASFPADNLASPSTYKRWRSASTANGQTLTNTGLPANDVDYVAIAGHNFGSAAIPISLEGRTSTGPDVWATIVPTFIPPDNAPLIFRFAPQAIDAVRILFGSGGTLSTFPEAAVLYVGRILILERKIWTDHTPITFGRIARIANGRSESGNFLGRIVLNEKNETKINVQHVTPAFYRSNIDPFIEASKEFPFFVAWRPNAYPNETGYAWMMNEPAVTHASPHGLMQLELQLQGLA